ncbi:MAG: peptidoglycan editing factor PgeF [Deltaproteobacteria bacterium]|nr:peptidoglycan editing factor PgeF [Deltaproteobacteria bacterium]
MNVWSIAVGGESFAAHFFGRPGGVSEGPRQGLNLGRREEETPEALAENERRVITTLGVERLFLPKQVHGCAVQVVTEKPDRSVTRGEEADAVITDVADLAVGVLTADCVPVLIAERGGRAVAAAHAGWRGLVADVLGETVRAFARYGAGPGDLLAFVGPSIGPCCYEVGNDLAERFAASPWGRECVRTAGAEKPALDLPLAAVRRLGGLGLASRHIRVFRRCTACETAAFFSHRRDGAPTGRQLSAIRLSARGRAK